MRMPRFTLGTRQSTQGPQAVIEVDGGYYPLATLVPRLRGISVRQLFDDWDTSLALLQEQAARIRKGGTDVEQALLGVHTVSLLAPILYPDKMLAVGANYSGHLKEMDLEQQKGAAMPLFLRPPTTTLVGPGDTVKIPSSTNQFDWECELAVFVARALSHASREEAAEAIAGYAIGLDLSCRDLIWVNNALKVDLVRGKAQDTMGPCGPMIVPAQFVPDVTDLRIQLWVNGENMMDASTSEMLWKVDEQLSIISQYITLAPGDILFTGSPSGSAGVHGNRWLQPGDQIRATIEQVGTFEVTMQQAGNVHATARETRGG